MYFLYLSRSELTKSYITINTKNGKTKTIEKIIPIIQVEDPNETSVIEYLGELEEAVHLAQDAFSQKPKIEEYSRRKYTRRLKFGVHLELSSGRPNFFYTVSSISKIFCKHICIILKQLSIFQTACKFILLHKDIKDSRKRWNDSGYASSRPKLPCLISGF